MLTYSRILNESELEHRYLGTTDNYTHGEPVRYSQAIYDLLLTHQLHPYLLVVRDSSGRLYEGVQGHGPRYKRSLVNLTQFYKDNNIKPGMRVRVVIDPEKAVEGKALVEIYHYQGEVPLVTPDSPRQDV